MGQLYNLDARRGSSPFRAAGSTSIQPGESTSIEDKNLDPNDLDPTRSTSILAGGSTSIGAAGSTSIEDENLDPNDLDPSGSKSTARVDRRRSGGVGQAEPEKFAAGTGRRRTPKEGEDGWIELLEQARQVERPRGKVSANRIREQLHIAPATAARLRDLIEAEDQASA